MSAAQLNTKRTIFPRILKLPEGYTIFQDLKDLLTNGGNKQLSLLTFTSSRLAQRWLGARPVPCRVVLPVNDTTRFARCCG